MEQRDETRLVVPTGFSRHLRELAESRRIEPKEALVEALNKGLTGTTIPPASTLEDAADMFMRYLPMAMVELIRELCQEHPGRKPWQYLLSYLTLAYERGETAVFVGEADLLALSGSENLTPDLVAVCQWCQKEFKPVRRGQKYCPDPDDGSPSCGRHATLAELHKTRPPDRVSPQHELAAKHGFGR